MKMKGTVQKALWVGAIAAAIIVPVAVLSSNRSTNAGAITSDGSVQVVKLELIILDCSLFEGETSISIEINQQGWRTWVSKLDTDETTIKNTLGVESLYPDRCPGVFYAVNPDLMVVFHFNNTWWGTVNPIPASWIDLEHVLSHLKVLSN